MRVRCLLAGVVIAAGVVSVTPSQATTLTSSFATWAAAVGQYDSTSSTGLPLYTSPVASVALSDGTILSLVGSADTVLQPLNGWGPWSGSYAGDIIDSTTNSETISFASSVSALGMELSPDLGLFSGYADTFIITLSDGATAQYSGTYTPGTTQFFGFYGGGDITSVTIASQNAPDFAFGNFVDVPEPISLSMMLSGLCGIGVTRLRRRGQGYRRRPNRFRNARQVAAMPCVPTIVADGPQHR